MHLHDEAYPLLTHRSLLVSNISLDLIVEVTSAVLEDEVQLLFLPNNL